MNNIKKITKRVTVLIFCLMNTNAFGLFSSNHTAGSGAMQGMLLGGAVGGLAGGGRGAGYGMLAGGMIGAMSGAAAQNSRNQQYGPQMGYNPNSRTSMRNYIGYLEDKARKLEDENYDLSRSLNLARPRNYRSSIGYDPKSRTSLRNYINDLENRVRRLEDDNYDLRRQEQDMRQGQRRYPMQRIR
jgi:hypothetical protein